MDRRTVVAIALCLLVLIAYYPLLKWLGLDRYLRPPGTPARVAAVDSAKAVGDTTRPAPALSRPSLSAATPPAASVPPVLASGSAGPVARLERTTHVETPLYRAEFTNRGARLVAVELKHYASAHGPSSGASSPPRRDRPLPPGDRVVLAGGPSLSLDLGSGDGLRPLGNVIYQVAESLDAAGRPRAVTFTAQDSTGLRIRQTYRMRPDDYAMDLEVELSGVPLEWRLADYSLTARSWPLLHEYDPAIEERSLRAVSLVGTNLHREAAVALRRGPRAFDGNVLWAGVQSRYFLGVLAVVQAPAKSVIARTENRALTADEQKLMLAPGRGEQPVAVSSLVLGLPSEASPVHRFTVYFGPGEYFRLARLGMGRSVDLGWNWILPFSKALLQLLIWLHALMRNFGMAIILLATLVRVVLHPLNMMSMKSMRAMQKLQPEIERIRQKYKNDAQAMNTAVMALYKENKVNPAGGCLPMLIQMPLFFALYSVLYNAIELRQAPFVGWIRDLSAPEVLMTVGTLPIRLLPLLMAASGLLSQRLTPTDPRQVTSMYLMNVVMVVFFYNLPSGLVLYWTVMNLLTALQQWMVLHEDGSRATAGPGVPAVARRAAPK
ncbi:MAG TPA: membrane protein insertase YidC [Candidatus Eisenbacteria bacterium]|jgi:YidC/Oxa1 family membrane protein insertase